MLAPRLTLVAVAAALLLLAAVEGAADDSLPQRPTRPESFSSQREVDNYIRKLQEYYSIIGRGRYGKRAYMAPLIQKHLPQPDQGNLDLLDFLLHHE